MDYIDSQEFVDAVEKILVELDYNKRNELENSLIAEGLTYIERTDAIAQEQAESFMRTGIEAVLKYREDQVDPSLLVTASDLMYNISRQFVEQNEAFRKYMQEHTPKKRTVNPCPIQPWDIKNELVPPIEYVGSEEEPKNEKYVYAKGDKENGVYPMLQILQKHPKCHLFQLEGIGEQTCGGVGKTYTLCGVMHQVNKEGKNPAVYLQLKLLYRDGQSENQIMAEVEKQLEEEDRSKALLLLDGYNELPSIACQMRFIQDLASYQAQYPNSTIVIASRTKMRYEEAFAAAGDNVNDGELEILKNLKHCYILVLEQDAIEEAIKEKIRTQEELETLSTPFYITLYQNTSEQIEKDYTNRWITQAQRQSYKQRKKSKTALLIAQMIREIEKLKKEQSVLKAERRAFVLTKVFPVIGYQLYQIAIVQENLANSAALLAERKVTLETLHDITYWMLKFFKDNQKILRAFPEYEHDIYVDKLSEAWGNFINTKKSASGKKDPSFGARISATTKQLNDFIPFTEMPFDILTYNAEEDIFTFSHDNYRDFFAAFHIANVYWMLLHSSSNVKPMNEWQYKIFCLQLDATERSILIMAIEILHQYYGVELELASPTFCRQLDEFLNRDMDWVARLTALNIAIRFLETNLFVEQEHGQTPPKYETDQLHEYFSSFCTAFNNVGEDNYARSIYATFYTYVKCLLARDFRIGRGCNPDLMESLSIAAEAKDDERKLQVARADGCMQIGLTLSEAMDQFLNAEDKAELLQNIWERAQDWLGLADRIDQLLEDGDDAEIKAELKREFGEKCLAGKETFACMPEFLTMLRAAKNKYDVETDETRKKIYGLGYISKALLIFSALGSSVGAMNRIALMFMNQQDMCEQDHRLVRNKTSQQLQHGTPYQDNYLAAWKIFYAGVCITRSTQVYSRLKLGELVFKNFVGFKDGKPVQRATQRNVPEEAEIDDNNFTLMSEHIDIAERSSVVMSTYWRGRVWQEHGLRVHDTSGFDANNAAACFDATGVSQMNFEEQRISGKPLPFPKMINLIELIGYPEKIPDGERLEQAHELISQALRNRIQTHGAQDYKISSGSYRPSAADFRYEIGRYKQALSKRSGTELKIAELTALEKTI